MGSTGEWLQKALLELRGKIENGLDLDAEVVSGLASYCELAPPEDAAEYLTNIIGLEVGENIIQEYLKKRGYVDPSNCTLHLPQSTLKAYMKPQTDEGYGNAPMKHSKGQKERTAATQSGSNNQNDISKGNFNISKKKKGAKVSLEDAAKGSVIYQKGKPCSCQARRHKLVSNCLSCGKIVCEQEGEGPCNFCGALVLREGSTYAGLESTSLPMSDAEVAAEAFAKRLVEYDRNSAARTTVYDDQSDYYEIEGNSWLSKEEKDLLIKKQQEIKEAEQKRKNKVIVTFDLVGRKVLVNEDDASELVSEHSILRPPEEREVNRIQPNPNIRVQPVFVNIGSSRQPSKAKQSRLASGLCLEVTGRVQYDDSYTKRSVATRRGNNRSSDGKDWQSPPSSSSKEQDDSFECSLDYN